MKSKALMIDDDDTIVVIIEHVRLHTEQQGLELLDDSRRVSPRSRVISLGESRNLSRRIAVEGRPHAGVSLLTGLALGTIGPMYLRAKKKMQRIAASDGVRISASSRGNA